MTLQTRRTTVIRPAATRPPAAPPASLTACWAGTAASTAVLALLWAFQPSAAAEIPGLPGLRLAPEVAQARAPERAPRAGAEAPGATALAYASLGL